jgi:hypothetical protein
MQESKLLGKLLRSSPDFLPLVEQMRDKYGLPELAPDDEPIEEIFLDGEAVALARSVPRAAWITAPSCPHAPDRQTCIASRR